MQLTCTMLCLGAAFVCSIANAMGKCPVWVPLILLCIVELLQVLPK